MSMRIVRCLVLVGLGVVLAGFSGPFAAAQLPTATILGTVKDASGAVIPESTVTVTNTETGLSRSEKTGRGGDYRFSALPVGSYEVKVEMTGFQSKVEKGLTLTISQEAVLNFSLDVGSVTEAVSVTAEAPLVDTTSGTIGTLVAAKTVSDLPLNGRNYIDLTLLQPGINQHRLTGTSASVSGLWFSSNGAPLRSNNYLLDGAPMASINGATSASNDGSTLGVEAVREFRVVTNAFSAEYGMTMGSQVTLVSKSGTNQFHGNAFDYFRNSALDARNFFDYKSTATSPDFRLPPYKRNQFGASVGGPIQKDKTFFYSAYEALRDRLGVTILDGVPSAGCHGAAGATITNVACPELGSTPLSVTIKPSIAPFLALWPNPNLPANQFTYPASQPTREDYGMLRLDQNFSSKDNFFGRYTIDDSVQTVPDNFGIPGAGQDRIYRGQFLTLSDNHIFSPTLLMTPRISFSRTLLLTSGVRDVLNGPQYSFATGYPMGGITISNSPINAITGLSGPDTPNLQLQSVYTYSDDLISTHGRHTLKYGLLVNQFRQYKQTTTQAQGSASFANMVNFLQGLATSYTVGTPGSIIDRTWHYNTYGFYLQDDFKMLSRLTLNLGLRYEFMGTMNEIHDNSYAVRNVALDDHATKGPPFGNNSLKNFSPRFGFAWDVLGNGSTSLRGGFAELYDIGIYGSALGVAASGTPPLSSVSTVTGSASNPVAFDVPFTFPAGSIGKSLRTQDYFMPQPKLLSYNLTLQRQLPWRTALSVGYAGSRGIHITGTVEGNPRIPQGIPTVVNGQLTCQAPPAGTVVNPLPLNGTHCWATTSDPRTSPFWDAIEYKTGESSSSYNALQVVLSKQMAQGFQFQSSYTWSKLLDYTQGQLGAEGGPGGITPMNPTQMYLDRAPANFDIKQNWRFNSIYQLPTWAGQKGVVGTLVNGWQVSTILALQGGVPFNPTIGGNWSRSQGGGDRPDLVPGRDNSNITHGVSSGCTGIPQGTPLGQGGTGNLYYDPCAFTHPAQGFLGNAARNLLRGPGVANLDFSAVKNTAIPRLGESGRLEFRAEFFNILNRATFGVPNRSVFAGSNATEAPSSNAGWVTNTGKDKSRQIQFVLKLAF